MSTCFVIQPFDGGRFDKRYEDVFAPAITAAKLDPYRVDRDPKVSIPIEDIEGGIRSSAICLADITLDNPNVWFELGFAIASHKEVVLVCGVERATPFPFDVHHRRIIKYASESPRDFTNLQFEISSRLSAALEKEAHLSTIATTSPLQSVDGLNQHELITLATIAESLTTPDDHVSSWSVIQDIEKNGFTRIAALLALRSLAEKEFVTSEMVREYNSDEYSAYSILLKGWAWIEENQDKFALRTTAKKAISEIPDRSEDDDIPF